MQTTNTNNRPKRPRRSSGQWRALLLRFEQSSLTIKDFCLQENISRGTLQRWRTRFTSEAGASDFIELQPPTPTLPKPGPWSLELDLPGGGHLRIRSGL